MTAEEVERIKNLLPTDLGSAEIRSQIAADILRRSVFSAQMASATYLKRLRDLITELAAGRINESTVRAKLLSLLAQMGHSPLDGNSLKNPASLSRLNLIIDTQRQMASSVAVLSEQTDATLEQWPAWLLTRIENRSVPRGDWHRRWHAAYSAVGGEGALKNQMIALKSSPIWQALGDGAGGFTDTLGNPYPPFAYSSGLDWSEVSRETCIRLGLIIPDQSISRPKSVSLSPGEKDIADAARRYGFDFSSALEVA